MIKKVFAVILVLTVVVPLTVFGALKTDVSAADITYSVENGVLTISGTGPMDNYTKYALNKDYDPKKIYKVIIGEGITSIGEYAFFNSTVKFVTIPNTVTKISKGAFDGSSNLVSVKIPGSVKTIGDDAFNKCESMYELILENGVETIGEDAFSGSSIEAVTIPPSVKTIGWGAFSGCQKLTVTFSEGLETIGYSAFSNIGNAELTLPDSVKSIDNFAFSGCKNLEKVVTGKNLETIGAHAFYVYSGSKLNSVNLSKSQKLSTIGDKAFENAIITEIIIPNSVTAIGEKAFDGCSYLVTVKLPANLKSIGERAFWRTPIASIEIPSGVESIGEAAFDGCPNLTKIVIPHSVISLNAYAFYGCTSLTALDISGERLTLNNYAFTNCPISHVHIPSSLRVSNFAGKYGLPSDESCYFQIGADGKCPAAVCPFRDGDKVIGDVNGDGELTPRDLIILGKAYMNKNVTAAHISIADMDGSDTITPKDIIALGKLYMSMRG